MIDLEYGIPLLISLSNCCWFVLLTSIWFCSVGIACTNSGMAVVFASRPRAKTMVQNISLLVLGWVRVLPYALFLAGAGMVGTIPIDLAVMIPTRVRMLPFSFFG